MGWWDIIDSISDLADSLKNYLWSWVDDIAKYWVERADRFFTILEHTWYEVIEIKQALESKIDDIGYDTWELFDALNDMISDLAGEIGEELADAVAGVIETAFAYADRVVSDAVNVIDKTLTYILADLNDIWTYITDFLEETLTYILADLNDIWTYITDFLEDLIIALELRVTGVETYITDIIETAITVLEETTLDLSVWVENSAGWFTTQLETAKDTIIGWIEDSFISILEVVLEHEKE